MKNEWVNFTIKLTLGLSIGGLLAYGISWFLNNSYIIGNGLYIAW